MAVIAVLCEPVVSGAARTDDAVAAAASTCASSFSFTGEAAPRAPMATRFAAVAATGASDVWAVGTWTNVPNGIYFVSPLVEHWDGNTWKTASLPKLPEGEVAELKAVSADAPADVWAAGRSSQYQGYEGDAALLEHWNGSKWALVHDASPQPPAASAQLTSVAALSPTDVYAAGMTANQNGFGFRGYVEHWNGSSWTVDSPSFPATDRDVEFRSISAAGSQVWLGGLRVDSAGYQHALVAYRDATGWHIPAAPGVTTNVNAISSIHAVATSDVWVAGTSSDQTDTSALVAHRIRGTWQDVSPPLPTGIDIQTPSGLSYDATGVHIIGSQSGYGSKASPFAATWNGQSWAYETVPAPAEEVVTLTGIVRDGRTATIVGSHGPPYHAAYVYAPQEAPAVYRLSGSSSWTLSSAVTVTVKGGGSLNAIAAINASEIWAVGYWADYNDGALALIQEWNGTSWHTFQPFKTFGLLYGVGGIGPNDVWAVGVAQQSITPAEVLIKHWDGTTWHTMSGNLAGTLRSVAAISSSDVWAVGDVLDNNQQRSAITDHWDGVHWRSVKVSGSLNTVFNGVSAVATNDVWAAGTAIGGTNSALVERWDGLAWQPVSAPVVSGASSTSLYAIDAVADNQVWVAGEYLDDNGAGHPLIAKWDGTAWNQFPAADGPFTITNRLNSIVVSGGAVYAAGSSAGTFPDLTGLVEQLVDGSFQTIPVQNAFDGTSAFYGVTVSEGAPWIAGSSALGQQPLAERIVC